MLRTNLEFATLGHEARTIMITSAVEQEGKSTTIANLAVALARGRAARGARRPRPAPAVPRQVLRATRPPGLTQVALGHVTLDEALVRIPIAASEPPAPARTRNGNGNGNGNERVG